VGWRDLNIHGACIWQFWDHPCIL